jgi:hypothetical protein
MPHARITGAFVSGLKVPVADVVIPLTESDAQKLRVGILPDCFRIVATVPINATSVAATVLCEET